MLFLHSNVRSKPPLGSEHFLWNSQFQLSTETFTWLQASSEQRPHLIFFPPQFNTFSHPHTCGQNCPRWPLAYSVSVLYSLKHLPSPTPWAACGGLGLHITGLPNREGAALRRIWAEYGSIFRRPGQEQGNEANLRLSPALNSRC